MLPSRIHEEDSPESPPPGMMTLDRSTPSPTFSQQSIESSGSIVSRFGQSMSIPSASPPPTLPIISPSIVLSSRSHSPVESEGSIHDSHFTTSSMSDKTPEICIVNTNNFPITIKTLKLFLDKHKQLVARDRCPDVIIDLRHQNTDFNQLRGRRDEKSPSSSRSHSLPTELEENSIKKRKRSLTHASEVKEISKSSYRLNTHENHRLSSKSGSSSKFGCNKTYPTNSNHTVTNEIFLTPPLLPPIPFKDVVLINNSLPTNNTVPIATAGPSISDSLSLYNNRNSTSGRNSDRNPDGILTINGVVNIDNNQFLRILLNQISCYRREVENNPSHPNRHNLNTVIRKLLDVIKLIKQRLQQPQ